MADRPRAQYLGTESNGQAEKIEELVRTGQIWEARARDAVQELEIARTESEALAQMVLEGREREEHLEHDNLIMAARLSNLDGGSRTLTGLSDHLSAGTVATNGLANGNDGFVPRRRTSSRNSLDSSLPEIGESPLLTQRMAFAPKSSHGSAYSPLKSRKESGSPTVTMSRIAALSAARKASLDNAGRSVSGQSNALPVNGLPSGQRHVSNTSTASTTSDFGDHLPPREWLLGSRRGKNGMGELDEADERFLTDLTSQ